MNYIIGCGGIGAWLAHCLVKFTQPENITLVDGDTVEERNLDRQFFSPADICANKATALSFKLDCNRNTEFYFTGMIQHGPSDWLLCAADNHAARISCLESCDRYGCRCIIACNETWSSEAMYYQRLWQGTPKDPRVLYPEMCNNHAGDPLARAAGCTGAAQSANPQLASANMMAAAQAMHLYALWALSAKGIKRETLMWYPHHLQTTKTKLTSTCAGQMTNGN